MEPISEHGLGQMKAAPKPTPGRTPLPRRTVLPVPKQRRVSLNPMQQAQLNVRRMLAPQYSAADAEAARQNQAIQSYTSAVMQQLAGQGPQIASIYDPQIAQQSAMSNAAADSLRAVNPSGDVAKLLAAVGAPQAQTQQIQGNLNNVFNGGAAVGNYLSGVSPAAVLRSQETAAQALGALQPGFAALAGRQSLASALAQQSDTRNKIAAQAPGMIQNQLNAFASNSAKRQQIALEQNALGIKTNQAQQRINNQRAQFNQRQAQQIKEFNAKQTSAANKISASVSKGMNDGFAHNASGTRVLGADGKPVKFAKSTSSGTGTAVGGKPLTASGITTFLKGLAKTSRIPQTDASGNTKLDKNKKVMYQLQTQFRLPYEQAYQTLMATPKMTDKRARHLLDTIYPKGQGGRNWLTNEEQAALSRAKQPAATGVIDIANVGERRYITKAQAATLRRAKRLPNGFWYRADQGHTVYVIKPGY